MPIAIYRHMKLYVAIPRDVKPVVSNFHPRRLRNVLTSDHDDGSKEFSVAFTKMDRRLGLLIQHESFWGFHRGEVTLTTMIRRNGSVVSDHKHIMPRLCTIAWVENGVDKPIHDQFEVGISTQCIVEKYLHDNVPNPHDYFILMINFQPKKLANGVPQDTLHIVRDKELSTTLAQSDRSESADSWVELLLEGAD